MKNCFLPLQLASQMFCFLLLFLLPTVNWQTVLTVLQMTGQTVSVSEDDWSNCFPHLQMIGQTVFHLCSDWSDCFPPLQMIDQNVFYFCFCRGLVKLFLSDCRPLVKQFPNTSAVSSSDWVPSMQWIGQTVSSQRMTGQTVVDLFS